MAKLRKFPIGGTHLPENKDLTTGVPISIIAAGRQVVIPLRQHIGVPCRAVVAAGDRVSAAQLLGQNDEGLSAKVHSSVTGTVTCIESRRMIDHADVQCVVIGTDSDYRVRHEPEATGIETIGGPESDVPDAATVRRLVEEAGVVGMGGATFPTHVKLQVRDGTPIDSVIINGAECEPYITTDDRLMQERTAALFRGLEIIRRTVGAEQGYVACEVNKPEAIDRIHAEASRWPRLQAVRLDTRYPHGAEKHLIKAVLNREVPVRQLPMSVGVVVNNVQTALAIARAVDDGNPLTTRVLTVSGSAIASPGNFEVPIGMPIGDVIEAAGGATSEEYKVIIGGPMTGTTTEDLSIPVTKGTSGIVLIRPHEYADRRAEVCIRCGRCVSVCPMYLQPNRITAFVRHAMIEEAEEFGVNDCILCGACSFICPARRPLLQWLREGKAESSKLAARTRKNTLS